MTNLVPVHSIVVEDLNLSETLRLAAIRTGETNLTAVFHDVKKMYSEATDASYHLYVEALRVLNETESLEEFIKQLLTNTDSGIRVSIDEVLTVRINRLINHYTGIDISLESFIGDYHELISFIEVSEDKELLSNAMNAFKQSLLMSWKAIETNECPIEKIINWENGSGTRIIDSETEITELVCGNTTATITEIAIEETIIDEPSYSCVIMPLPKAAIYISSLITYSHFAGLLKDLNFPKVVTKESYPEVFSMLETYRNANEVFKNNQWTLLVLDKVYVQHKYWEVYYSVAGEYHFVLPYQN